MDRYIVTGNDFVSLPCIRERDGALLDVTFLYRSLKGAINVKGRENEPFLLPFFCVGGKHVVPRQLSWRKTEHWIPSFTFVTAEAEWECTYLAAREARGFLMHLSCKNKTGRPLPLQWGASGCWSETDHATNNDFRMELPMRTWTSWHGLPVFGAVQGVPLFVFRCFITFILVWAMKRSLRSHPGCISRAGDMIRCLKILSVFCMRGQQKFPIPG